MLEARNLPTRTQLWNNAILTTIAHAISVAERGAYYVCEWSGPTTIFANGCGDEGAITFGERGTVAVFFAHESERSAYGYENGEGYDIEQFFVGIPRHLRKYADDMVLTFFRFDKWERPGITAAFWGEGETMTAVEPWVSLREHGGFLVEDALLAIGEAIAKEQKGLAAAQAQLLERLFHRRMTADDRLIALTKDELAILGNHGKADLQARREVLMGIGIVYP